VKTICSYLVGTLVMTAAFATPARAETLFVPWLGVNTGGTASTSVNFGATIGGTLHGVLGADLDAGYSPGFFGNGLNSRVVTVMGNATVGIPFDGAQRAGLRPYVTAGLGVVHASVEAPLLDTTISHTNLGVNAGGGVMAFWGRHLGVRADLRYIRSLDDANSIDSVRFWRTSFGVTLR